MRRCERIMGEQWIVHALVCFFHFPHFCDWGSFIALAGAFGFVALKCFSGPSFYVGGRTLRWAFVRRFPSMAVEASAARRKCPRMMAVLQEPLTRCSGLCACLFCSTLPRLTCFRAFEVSRARSARFVELFRTPISFDARSDMAVIGWFHAGNRRKFHSRYGRHDASECVNGAAEAAGHRIDAAA